MIAPVVFIFALMGFVLAGPGKLPEEMPKCKKSDPKFDDCLAKAIQASLPVLIKGIPKLGLFSLDPLKITTLHIDQNGSKGPVALDLIFKDLQIKGLQNVVINEVESDLNNYKLVLEVFIPKILSLDGNYEMKGNVLILPLQGKGKAHLSLENVKATLTLLGKESTKNGVKYMELEKFILDYETTKLTQNFEDLFSQNKAVGDNLNTFLNENWEEIHKELYPAIKQALGMAFKEIAARIFSKVPFDDIFLP